MRYKFPKTVFVYVCEYTSEKVSKFVVTKELKVKK